MAFVEQAIELRAVPEHVQAHPCAERTQHGLNDANLQFACASALEAGHVAPLGAGAHRERRLGEPRANAEQPRHAADAFDIHAPDSRHRRLPGRYVWLTGGRSSGRPGRAGRHITLVTWVSNVAGGGIGPSQ